jgi:rhamnulokinase
MSTKGVFLAVDLGASSGRVVAGLLKDDRLSLEEHHRFENGPVSLNGSLYWDALRLFGEIKTGIRKAAEQHKRDLVSVGIDTWGVDCALLDGQDRLIGNPYHYRDERLVGIPEKAFERVPKSEIYQATGLQFLIFNTLYQLLYEVYAPTAAVGAARHLLMMPDLFHFWLTGVKANEYTIASTSQMMDPRNREWALPMLRRLGIPTEILGEIVPPGTTLGKLRLDVAEETGAEDLSVVAPGSHDTASAVAAVPATEGSYAFLSSGTWSLMGLESKTPIISDKGLEYGFANEGGVCDTIRFLKNISGLWMVQECRRAWASEGQAVDFETLAREAAAAEPFVGLVDPDHDDFGSPGDMPSKIQDFCKRTDQRIPQDRGTIVRTALESLALKYRFVLERLEEMAGYRLDTLHIVGGGTQNKLLNQFAANAVEREVVTGPVEATSAGNILMQLYASGEIASLSEGRELIRRSFETETYTPEESGSWQDAFQRFEEIL